MLTFINLPYGKERILLNPYAIAFLIEEKEPYKGKTKVYFNSTDFITVDATQDELITLIKEFTNNDAKAIDD